MFKNTLLKFIENGLSFVFPVESGAAVRGIPTAQSALILKDHILSNEIYVWPTPNSGKAKGQDIAPLYPNFLERGLET